MGPFVLGVRQSLPQGSMQGWCWTRRLGRTMGPTGGYATSPVNPNMVSVAVEFFTPSSPPAVNSVHVHAPYSVPHFLPNSFLLFCLSFFPFPIYALSLSLLSSLLSPLLSALSSFILFPFSLQSSSFLSPGLFVPMHRISKAVQQSPSRTKKLNGKKDSLYITNKAIEAQSQIQMNTDLQVQITPARAHKNGD